MKIEQIYQQDNTLSDVNKVIAKQETLGNKKKQVRLINVSTNSAGLLENANTIYV